MATCLLSYQFSTAPIPLQVNPVGSTATSRINLAVFNPTPGVYCSQIMVAVPIGATAADFCVEPPTASVNTGKWTIASQQVVTGAAIGAPAGSYAQIIFQCRDKTDYGIGYSLVLSLVGVVNSAVGAFEYYIQEMSGTSPDDLTPKAGQHSISKQDAVFTLRNFVATAADAPTVPGTRFSNGQALRLSWESNGRWFQLYAKGGPAPIYAGPATSYSLSAGLAADAQFILVASVTGDPGQDSPSPGYQTIYLYDALTLVVANPDLTPRSVAADGGISTTAGLTSAGLTVSGQATVGPLTAAAATVQGRTTAAGGLTVGSASAPTETELFSKLAVSGPTVLSSTLSVTADETVGGTLKVTGPTTMGNANAVVLDAGTVNTGRISVSGPDNSLYVHSGQLFIDTGNRNAAQVFNTSQQSPAGWFQNRSARSGNYVTGVVGWVVQGSDTGLYTNGRIGAAGGMAVLTHLPTRHGHRVVTSPLVIEAEVHISGSARLAEGRARVVFDEGIADLILYSGEAPYRVLATPTGQCAGLVVVAKAPGHFVVEEASHGRSDAPFDWIVITRQRSGSDASVAMELPAELPEPLQPPTP